MLVTLFVFKRSTDFRFQFLPAFIGITNVGFQLGGTLLEALERGFKGTNRALCGVGDARGVTVLAAHDHFDRVVEAGAQEQIESSELSNANVIPETVLELFRSANNQLTGDATVVERLPIEFDREFVTRRVVPN